ncbi:MAG: EpsI family protein [Candidatus Hydrogenedentes bacterium]|nr:EpsI family protein [Candidatus Hydrogenedentota bacterium]
MIRRVIILLLLAATALAHRTIMSLQTRPEASAETPIADLPNRVLDFKQLGEDVPVEPHVIAVLENANVLIRNYVSSRGVPVQLTVVYTGETRRSLHFPEVCLTGQGWEIREQYSAPVGVQFIGKRLVLFKGDSEQAVLYWFKTGDTLTGSYLMNSLNWSRDQLLFRKPGSMMVKVNTAVDERGAEAAFRTLDEFAIGLAPILLEQFK